MKAHKQDLIPTRASLLARLKHSQDESSWREFFETYWKLIYAVALKAGLADAAAQDVVQGVLMHVAKQMPTFKYDASIGSFKGWLLTKTRWCIIEQRRRRGSHIAQLNTSTCTIDEIVDPARQAFERMWDDEWGKNSMKAAIASVKCRVDPKQYQIFDIYVLKEWPLEKVAKAFGVTNNQVYIAKHRVSAMIEAEVRRVECGLT